MRNKLIVAGCSFSDYLPRNRTVYGRELALLLDRDYCHQGAGAGSNWRIWREVGTGVLNGLITTEDLVIIQYTGLERREFWTAKTARNSDLPLAHDNRDPWPGGGELLRYKAMSWTWQDHNNEREFLKKYEENHCSTDYEQTWFDLQHHQFQLLLRHHRIPTVFLDARLTTVRPLPLIEPFDQWHFLEPQKFMDQRQWDYEPGDCSHLSDQGHRKFAKLLLQHCQQLDLKFP